MDELPAFADGGVVGGGIAMRPLSPAEAYARCPPVDRDDLVAAADSRSEGHARSAVAVAAAADAYVLAARRRGTRAVMDCDLLDVEVGRV